MVTHIVPEVFFYVTRSQRPRELHLDDNADALREAFSDYVAATQNVTVRSDPGSAGSKPSSYPDELAKIREWAGTNEHEVSSRGRIRWAFRYAFDTAR